MQWGVMLVLMYKGLAALLFRTDTKRGTQERGILNRILIPSETNRLSLESFNG